MDMEELFNLDPSLADELWARVMAQELLKLAKSTGEKAVARRMDSEAVRVLEEIKAVLNDPELNDPDCFYKIDAIVDVFFNSGLSTRRHEECE